MKNTYRKDIDGLRAIAVLSVVFYHAGFSAFRGGYLGVDIFFVISGYLITSIILSGLRTESFSFLRFYERRVRRIFPALIAMILVTVPLSWILLTPADFKDFSQSIGFALASISNLLFWIESDYFDTVSELKPLIHTWSLGIEEQFYLVFPVILMAIWHFFRKYLMIFLILLIITSLVFAEMTQRTDQAMSFYFIHTRAWELMTGSLIAYWGLLKPVNSSKNIILIQLIGLIFIFGSIFLFSFETAHPGFITVIPVIGSALLLRYGNSGRLINLLLGNIVLVKIGLISYSLYLFHHPIFAFMRHYLLAEPSFYNYILGILFSITVAYGSYKFIETPFRNKDIIKGKIFWPLNAFLVSLLIGISIFGHVTDGYPKRLGNELSKIYKAEKGIEPTTRDGGSCHGTFPNKLCMIGDKKSQTPSWALIGDSHAATLGLALDETLKQIGSSAIQLTQGGCSYALNLTKIGANCFEMNQLVRSEILKSDIKNIVIAGRYVRNLDLKGFDNGEGGIEDSQEDNYYEPLIYTNNLDRRSSVMSSYFDSINELLLAGKNVYLIYPIPEVGWDVPRQILKYKIHGINDQVSTSASNYYKRSSEVINIFDNLPDVNNLHRIYPDNIFCNTELENRCITELAGELLYFDDDHLTTAGAKLLTKVIFESYSTNLNDM